MMGLPSPQWLDLPDGRLAVQDAGGAGRPVLFQHGLCGDARQAAEAFPADPRFRRITLECRGHGASPASAAPRLAQFANDLAALADRFAGPVVMGGISMGAALTLRLAVLRPEKVAALVLVRPAWGVGLAGANLSPNAVVGDLLARLSPDMARAAFAALPLAETLRQTAPDNLASLMGFFDRQPPDVTARLLSVLSRDDPGLDAAALAALRLPVLVCGCDGDAIHPLSLSQDLARLIPGATHVTLPPKATDKPAHLAALHRAITTFLTEI